jgi:uncharacterized protein YecT (DUF1311 family)
MAYLVSASLTGAFLLASLALVSVSGVAQSATDFSAIDAKEKACEVAKQTVNGSALCEQSAQSAADRRLNEVYAQIVDKIKQPQDDPYRAEIVQRLIAAERAWVVFRDAECTYESSVAINAPLEGYEYQACRYEQTKARIKALADPKMPQNAR